MKNLNSAARSAGVSTQSSTPRSSQKGGVYALNPNYSIKALFPLPRTGRQMCFIIVVFFFVGFAFSFYILIAEHIQPQEFNPNIIRTSVLLSLS